MTTKTRYADLDSIDEIKLADTYSSIDNVLEDRQKIRHLQIQYLTDHSGDEVLSGENKAYYDKLESNIQVLDKLAHGFRSEEQLLNSLDEMRAKAESTVVRGADGEDTVSLTLGEAIKAVTLAYGPNSQEGAFELPMVSTRFNPETGGRDVFLADTPVYMGSQRTGRTLPKERFSYEGVPINLSQYLPDKNGLGEINLNEVSTSTSNIDAGLPELVEPMVKRMFDIARVAAWCRVRTTAHGNKLKFRRREHIISDNGTVTSTQNPAGNVERVGEGAEIPRRSPTFEKVELNAEKLGWITDLTYELIQDLEGGDIEQEILDDAGVALGLQLSWFIVNGSGTNQATGLGTVLKKYDSTSNTFDYASQLVGEYETSTAISAAPTNNSTLITYPKMVDVMHSIPDSYVNDPTCAFFTSWYNVGKLRQVLDNEKRPIFDMDPTGVFPGRILGKPVVADPAFSNIPDNIWTTGNNLARGTFTPNIIFGCWKNYILRLAGGLRVDRSIEDRFSYDEVSWRFLQRYDGNVLDPYGFSAYSFAKVS